MTDQLANVIKKQQAEVPAILKLGFIEREVKPLLSESLSSSQIKVILGPRRAGKSTLALQCLREKKFAYLNLEDEALNFAIEPELILHAFDAVYPEYEYILFDEVQLIPNWEKFLNRLSRLGKNLIVTGSNSKLLSSELASSLTGRHLSFELLPFSFAEYLMARSGEPNFDNFMPYLKSGGFPLVILNQTFPREFLTNLWDSIVLKDLVERYKIRRARDLKNLLYILLTQMSSRTSLRALSRTMNDQLSHSTISKFTDYAKNAYLCCLLQGFSYKSRERVNAEKKMYLYDNGFYSAHQTLPTADYGRLLENYVFVELCRRGYTPNLDFFYYRTKSGYEVDFFLCPEGRPLALYQVAYSTQGMDTLKRETRALIAASNELNVKHLYLVTLDSAEKNLTIEDKSIQCVPAWGKFITAPQFKAAL